MPPQVAVGTVGGGEVVGARFTSGKEMSHERLPIIILGGSDRKPTTLPERGRDKHPLAGYKGMEVRLGDRSLVDTIADRLQQAGSFGPIYLAGPASVYRGVEARLSLIDTNGSFGDNIKVALERVRRAHPGMPVGFITCDVLPDVVALQELMQDYDRHRPCDVWFPLIRTPSDPSRLGASEWKPSYRVVPREGEPAVGVLPGHLMIVEPQALRREFLYRLFQLGYRTRNRPIKFRRTVMVRGLILELLYQDLRHIFGLRAPTLTWTVLSTGLSAARELKAGTITQSRLETAVRRLFVHARHLKRHPERRARLPLVDALSLALDIDTEEEARQLGADLAR